VSNRVEVAETTWRTDAPHDQMRRLSMLLLGPATSKETPAHVPADRLALDQVSDAQRSAERGVTGAGDE